MMKNKKMLKMLENKKPFTVTGVWEESPNGDVACMDTEKVYGRVVFTGNEVITETLSTCPMFIVNSTSTNLSLFANNIRFAAIFGDKCIVSFF